MGEPPEVEVVRPREGGKRIEGAFGNGKLEMQISPARVDLRMVPSLEQEVPGFPTIGKFTEILALFTEVTSRWLNLGSCPEIRRIAFGAGLLSAVENRVSGYRQLAGYLPSVNIDPEHSSDFLYQINRTRKSGTGIADLTINRLSKWYVATMSTAGLVLEPTQVLQHEMSQQYFACRLELDINTTTVRQEALPRETVPSIFAELMDLGQEIVREGDIT